MRRVHLVELEDLEWFPSAWRDALTDALALAHKLGQAASVAAPLVKQLLDHTGEKRIVDVCSGAGGPLSALIPALDKLGANDVHFTLTDKYPNHAALERVANASHGRIDFVHESVDATDVPEILRGVRTQFASFHHFAPDAARAILSDCVRKRQAIGVFEYTGRSLGTMASVGLIPLGQWLTAPFQRPWRWSRLIYTYALPAIPFTLYFDGMVSCLRTYGLDELEELTRDLGDHTWRWEMGQRSLPLFPVKMTYLLGYPV
jgi:hypothetical protein